MPRLAGACAVGISYSPLDASGRGRQGPKKTIANQRLVSIAAAAVLLARFVHANVTLFANHLLRRQMTMGSTIKRCLGKLACTAAIIGAAAMPAQAARYTGTFDPLFGNGFTGLGWEGVVTFEVPDACLALGTADFTNVECQTSSVLGATVKLFNFSTPSNSETLDFFGPSLRLSIDDVTILGGTVTGLFTSLLKAPFPPGSDTNPSDWLAPAGTLDYIEVDDRYALYRYGLEIDADKAILRASSTVVDFVEVSPNVFDFVDTAFGCPWDGDYAICDSATSPTVTFTRLRVPEPGSLMLVAAALAAAGCASRPRRRR